ncbi:helix-turn-helix protein [Micromonospora pisi]|uniref:Helix-turn-helix protein n=1 Tax=Micromonospora pisi TaxID=589240 RepID=A0A495JJD0_9ACTN|nr:helix-turn-helix transcriptional regulator [Micromonospora pisi]RKR88422.1 helix-turn-helix protein [Micromonospora pisi]
MRERHGPVEPRLSVCRQLREAREGTGHTQTAVAELLGWGQAKVQRIEAGQVAVSTTDLRAMLDLYGVHDQEARSQLEISARKVRRQPWGTYRDVLTPQERTYLGGEGSATRLRHYAPLLLPDLLRTEAYAWAAITSFTIGPPDHRLMRRKLEVVLARQEILDRNDPPHLQIVLDEAALHRPIAGTDGVTATRAQMARLRDLARRDNISLQVLPMRAGLPIDEPITVLDLPNGEHVAYLPRRSRVTVTDRDQVDHYDHAFAGLAEAAIPLAATVTPIFTTGQIEKTP